MIGFDMVTFYVSYRGSILSCSLSPLLNQRTDQYGGPSMKDRATLTLEIFRRVREACGEDFIIEVQISGSEEAPGYTEEDFLDYCALCEGLVDIFQIRGWDGSYTHVNGHNTTPENPYNLRFAEAFKNGGSRQLYLLLAGSSTLSSWTHLYVTEKQTVFPSHVPLLPMRTTVRRYAQAEGRTSFPAFCVTGATKDFALSIHTLVTVI